MSDNEVIVGTTGTGELVAHHWLCGSLSLSVCCFNDAWYQRDIWYHV